ncbi:MAG TPA: hypothetical protein VHO06_17605 [Polyangia bacterium]|nr:hypothetical protein [Polyangia bacterium]
MPKLPDARRLAALVSHVTGTMFGPTFVPADQALRGESLCEQMFMIRLKATPGVVVVLSVDARAGRKLSAAFLRCPERDLSRAMVDDVISELLNMVAGQIAKVIELDQLLGLPRRTTLGEMAQERLDLDDAILLRSEGEIDLGLWILEE